MKIRLDSDFLDYYDYWFAGRHEKAVAELSRRSVTDMTKEMQFWIMERAGLQTPAHGLVRDLYENGFDPAAMCVVYTDPYAHRGDGKERMSLAAAYAWHKDAYCSKFVYSGGGDRTPKPFSMRVLGVGNERFVLYYEGSEGWKSNHAREVDITWDRDNPWVDRLKLRDSFSEYPLWAVDFVENQWGEWLAVDFNTAPQIRGTGIEDEYSPGQIYRMIETWFEERKEWI